MKTVLLGNGINRCSGTYEWINLLDRLVIEAGKKGIINLENKPFPILYEEIYLRGLRYNNISESSLLTRIEEDMRRFLPNEVHEILKDLKFENILTTNYDYNIEKSLGEKFVRDISSGKSVELKYRIRTFNEISNKKIWHIHGEIDKIDTLVLGHDKYTNNVKRYIDYIENEMKAIKNIDRYNVKSWIDLFFVSDIHIIGFGFDFSEIDLWWLLNKRARLKFDDKIEISNKIYFHIVEKDSLKENLIKVLESHDVHVVKHLKENDYKEFYRDVLRKV